ncbi:MAG: APC family permease [Candidatus Bathyarchaeia archaeon]
MKISFAIIGKEKEKIRGGSMSSSKEEVFIRKSSGLVRPFGTMDAVLIFTLIIFSILNTTMQFNWFHGFWPGADFVGSIAFALIPTMLVALVYWCVAVAMPRAGSDYVWFARVVHPAIGFGWSLLYFYMYLCAAFVTICFAFGYTTSMALTAWGILYNIQPFVEFGTWLQSQWGSFVFALIIMVIYTIIGIAGSKAVKAFLYVGWAFQIVALLVYWVVLGTTTTSVFAAKWDQLMGGYISYNAVYTTAASAGWTWTPISIGATVASMAFGFMILSGAAFGAGTITGEIRNVNRAIPIGLVLANLLSFGIWSLCNVTLLYATDIKWFTALSWLWANHPETYPLPFPPSTPLMLAIATHPNQALTGIAMVTFVLANIAFPLVTYITAARYWFAWGFDRLVPTKLADVHPRFKTPHIALIVTTIIAMVSGYLYAYLGFANWFAAVSTIMVLSYAVVSLTVVVFPFTRWKTLLDNLPKFMSKKIAGVPFISIIGLIASIVLFYSAYAVAVNPLLSANFDLAAILFGGLFIAGIIIYFISKEYHKRQGIDITLGFKEVPPA